MSENYDGTVILWNKISHDPKIFSILVTLKRTNQIYDKLLYQIYRVSKSQINKKSFLEHLSIENDFSYWWMTSLGQKEPFANGKSIYNLMRLISLFEILDKIEYDKIEINFVDKKNKLSLANNRFEVINKFSVVEKIKSILYTDFFLFSISLIKFFFFYLNRIGISSNTGIARKVKEKKLYFFDILTHYKLESSKYISGYWGELKNILMKKKFN